MSHKTEATVKGYKIDFSTNTLTMNYKFAQAAKQFGTEEYNLIKSVQADFPSIKIITKPGKRITTPRKTKRMTYTNMEKYIKTFDNSDILLSVFKIVKEKSILAYYPYKYVLDWFEMQFPNYKTLPENLEIKTSPIPLNPPNIEDYKQKAM